MVTPTGGRRRMAREKADREDKDLNYWSKNKDWK